MGSSLKKVAALMDQYRKSTIVANSMMKVNIQLIFNPQKVLKSWDIELFNHTIKYCILKHVEDVKDRSNTYKGCNAMYVRDVEDGKRTYTHIFAQHHLWHLPHTYHYIAFNAWNLYSVTFDTFNIALIFCAMRWQWVWVGGFLTI